MRVRSCASPWWEASPRRSITPFTSCWCGVSTTSGRPCLFLRLLRQHRLQLSAVELFHLSGTALCPPCRAVPDGPPHQPCERTRTARNLAVGGRSETLCAAVRFSGRLSGQFPDGALRPARAFEILKKRTLPCDARQGLLLHLFGCSLGYFLILGSSSPYFFFRSSALSHSPSSIASTPHATKISIGRV